MFKTDAEHCISFDCQQANVFLESWIKGLGSRVGVTALLNSVNTLLESRLKQEQDAHGEGHHERPFRLHMRSLRWGPTRFRAPILKLILFERVCFVFLDQPHPSEPQTPGRPFPLESGRHPHRTAVCRSPPKSLACDCIQNSISLTT